MKTIIKEPEPDIAIVHKPDSRYLTHHPLPQEIYWLVEISDSTLAGEAGEAGELRGTRELSTKS